MATIVFNGGHRLSSFGAFVKAYIDKTQRGNDMRKTILFAAFSLSTKEEFESFILKRCKVGGFSRVDQWGVWTDEHGYVFKEPSHQYIFFALSNENYDRINDWFTRFTIENSLLWEEDGKGGFVDLRQKVTA